MATSVNEAVELLLDDAEVHLDQSLMEVGLNSMHAAQLRDIIYSDIGANYAGLPPLPATMVFDYPTKAAITGFLVNQVSVLAGPDLEQRDVATSKGKRRRRKAASFAEPRVKYEDILAYTRTTIGEVIATDVGDDVPLMEAGVNSMHAAQLRDFLQAEAREQMGLPEVHLPATIVFDFPTAAALAGNLFQLVCEAQQGEEEEDEEELAVAGQEGLEEVGAAEEPTWCVARAKRQLRTNRRSHPLASELKFVHLLEAPILEEALAGIGYQRSRGLAPEATAGDYQMGASSPGEEALQKLTTGYVKGEGRLLVVLPTEPQKDAHPPLFSQFSMDFRRFAEIRTAPPVADKISGSRRDVAASHRYAVSGTWSKWSKLEEMDATDNDMFVRTVTVRGGEVEEFQILQDGDWSMVHYPPPGPSGLHSADTMGPGEAHGRNFFLQVPSGEDRRCTIAFSPLLKRVNWQLSPVMETGAASSSAPPPAYEADPVRATAQRAAAMESDGGGTSSLPASRRRQTRFVPLEGYFLIGNWDGWKGFTSLTLERKEDAWLKAELPVKSGDQIEFQVVADRDTSKRFTPRRKVQMRVPVTGGKTVGIAGPTDLPSLHWVLQVPKSCKTLRVAWNPEGEKSLRWEFR